MGISSFNLSNSSVLFVVTQMCRHVGRASFPETRERFTSNVTTFLSEISSHCFAGLITGNKVNYFQITSLLSKLLTNHTLLMYSKTFFKTQCLDLVLLIVNEYFLSIQGDYSKIG